MSATGSNASILVVDDDDKIRQLVAFTLERRGCAVTQASARDETLNIIRAGRPVAVMVDVMMHRMSGIEVTRELRCDAEMRVAEVIPISARGVGTLVSVLLESSAG